MKAIFANVIHLLLLCWLAVSATARGVGGQKRIQPYRRQALQSIVTWDKHSLFVRGQRIMFFSGEFHPFRLPVPGLWLDVFQKIRALGFTGVSFYVDWALLEGQPGDFSAKGVFALEPFFEAATKAGIYLLARPGPYINAEVSGGGFPGWMQRLKGHPRTSDEDYLASTDLYIRSVGQIIAKAQITNGGPVVLFQPENEYTSAATGQKFPDSVYFQHVEDQYRAAGIVVPFVSNDASPSGHNAPGQPAAVDIYGHDGYPLGFDCANPSMWPKNKLPTNWRALHQQQSPNTPFSLIEFQGGAFDPWGGSGYENCAALLNHEFERVFNKNDLSFGVTIFNIYMVYGGTNWGNLGHPGGYTSYDYGAMIAEDRTINREKYAEAKLEANFIVVSPSYLTAVPEVGRNVSYVNTPAITASLMKGNRTQFLTIRHTDYSSTESTRFTVTLPGTSAGDIAIPQAGGSLTLNGRDSKILVFDYDVAGINVLYSTAEILTWHDFEKRKVLIVYTGLNEQHEMAIGLANGNKLPTSILGSGIAAAGRAGYTILSWKSSANDRAVQLGPLVIYFLDRYSAYQHWVLDAAREPPNGGSPSTPFTATAESSVIIKGGYLMRTASIKGTTLALTGDINATTTIQVIGGAPRGLTRLTFNDQPLQFTQSSIGVVTATITYVEPKLTRWPPLSALPWMMKDSLPEIKPGYSDAAWASADYPKTDNTMRSLTTPTSLYGSEYGYHTGHLLFRGRFQANGRETKLYLQTSGGSAFGMSAFIDGTFVGSFTGHDAAAVASNTFQLPKLEANTEHIITVVIDNMGLDENGMIGIDDMKNPRGILDYAIDGHTKNEVTWKITGNLGGEGHIDKSRGPLNEGGLWAERQGYHLPNPPTESWKASIGPTEGLTKPGITWYVTNFDLDMPRGYDIPLAFVFTNASTPGGSRASAFRINLYVNGWYFGKYVNNIGPQTKFPVPEGIFDYHGTNWIAMSLWALDAAGAKVPDIQLTFGKAIQTGYGPVKVVDSPQWTLREGAY